MDESDSQRREASAKPLLIVDGYNLIHAVDRYKERMESDLESARAELVEDMAALSTLADYEVIVIFDAGATASRERHRASILGVQVVFTKKGESADAVIERFSYETSGTGRRVVVATSDYMQQKIVFRPGVSIKSARQLFLEMEDLFAETARGHREANRPRHMARLEERIDGAVKQALDKLIRD
jgi:uncharacterized protein